MDGGPNSFRIERAPIDWGVDGYQYRILHADGRTGDAQLLFTRQNESHTKLNIQADSGLLAHINEFYPNGRGLDENSGENMRAGCGSEILNVLLADAAERRAELAYVFTGKPSMQAFLKKKDFQPARQGKNWVIFTKKLS